MILYTAPEPVPFGLPNVHSIFLAGSIEQGTAREWQQVVINRLQDKECVVFNPRRAIWDATLEQSADNPVFYEQVTWELDNLDNASIAFFYFQEGTSSPITLAEFGKVMQAVESGDPVTAVVVCDPGFWRQGNVAIMCERAGVNLYETLEDGINELRAST